MDWHPFEVDGEEFFWCAYPSMSKSGDGPWIPNEYLNIARQPDTRGIGRIYEQGYRVTEADAIDTVRTFVAAGRHIP